MTAGRSTPTLINQKNIIIPHIGNSQSHLVFRLVIRQVKVDFHFLRFADTANCAQSSKDNCQTKSFHCQNHTFNQSISYNTNLCFSKTYHANGRQRSRSGISLLRTMKRLPIFTTDTTSLSYINIIHIVKISF